MKLVPAPEHRVAGEQRARRLGSKKATWSALCPGACTATSSAPPAREPLPVA